jgi:hypothetical protein
VAEEEEVAQVDFQADNRHQEVHKPVPAKQVKTDKINQAMAVVVEVAVATAAMAALSTLVT